MRVPKPFSSPPPPPKHGLWEAAGTKASALLDASTSPARGSRVPWSAATGFNSLFGFFEFLKLI